MSPKLGVILFLNDFYVHVVQQNNTKQRQILWKS